MHVYIFTHLDVQNTSMFTFILAFCSVLLSFFFTTIYVASLFLSSQKIFLELCIVILRATKNLSRILLYLSIQIWQIKLILMFNKDQYLTNIVLFLCLLLFQTKCLLTFSHIHSHT